MLNIYYTNSRLLILTIAVVLVAGLSAYKVLPRQEDPSLTKRALLITTVFPGADATQVESLVTQKIEEVLEEIEEIEQIISSSRKGISVISVEISDSISSDRVSRAFSTIRNRVSDAKAVLPEQAGSPLINETDTEVDAYTLIAALVWMEPLTEVTQLSDPEISGIPFSVLGRHAENLSSILRAKSGTKQVVMFGTPEEEIVAEVDPNQLALLGLTADTLARLVAQSDSKLTGGQLRGIRSDLVLEVEGAFDTVQRVESTPILTGENGQILYLRDLAEVKKMIADPPSEISLIGGHPAVALGIRMEPGQRIDRWASEVRHTLTEYSRQLPRGISVEIIFDQSRYVEERIESLEANLLIGMFLVILVIVFTMGWRSALLVGSALPLVSLTVLWLLQIISIPLHQMSIVGLVIALGLLIDNTIVVVDEVTRELEEGLKIKDAVANTVRQLSVPLVTSTLTTVLAFMPIVLTPGGIGEFIGPIAISVILSVVTSLLVSLTVIAALAGRIGRPSQRSGLQGTLWNGFRSARLSAYFASALDWLFRKPVRGIALSTMLPLLGFLTFSQLEEQFFPPSDRDQFQVQLRLPEQAPISQTLRTALEARELMLQHPQVTEVHWFTGSNAPKFYYNMLSGDDGSPYFSQGLVQLKSKRDYFETINEIQMLLDQNLPKAQMIVRQLEQGPPFDAPVELYLYGPDLDQLRLLGEEFRRQLAMLPDVIHTRIKLIDGQPKLLLDVEEEELRLAGLDRVQVASQLQGILDGRFAGSVLEEIEELPVRIRIGSESRQLLHQISSIDLVGVHEEEQPAFIPLEVIGGLNVVPDLASIPHRNGIRSNTIQGFLTAGTLPSNVQGQLRDRIESVDLPSGYWVEVGGEAKERNAAVNQLLASAGVLVTVMIGAVVLSFNSFRLAGIIFCVGILALGSGLSALWVLQYPFGFVAIIGLMGLVGIAINDSIVVLSSLATNNPESVSETIAVVLRASRHVVSTTLTTIAGFLPLILAGGGLWPPLVVAISGGIVGGTLLALVFVPAAYRCLTAPKPVRQLQLARSGAAAALLLILLAPFSLLRAAERSPQSDALGEPVLDLTLTQAIEKAVGLNPRLQISNLRVLENRYLRDQVRSNYLPRVGIEGSGSYRTNNLGSAGLQFPGNPRRIGPFKSYDFRSTFRQNLFDLSLLQSIQAQSKRTDQSRWEAVSLQEAMILSVIQLYLDALEAQSRLEANRARLVTAERLLSQSKDFLEVGTANRLDYTRAEIQYQRERASLAQAEEILKTSRLRLLQTIGLSPGLKIRLTSTFQLTRENFPQPKEAVTTAMASRPEVSAIAAKLKAAELQLQSNRSERLPVLGFRADYGVSAEAIDRGVSTWGIAAEVRIPLLEGGRIAARIGEAKVKKKQVEEEVREIELEVESEVRTALAQLEAAWTIAEAASKAAAAARESLDLAQARFSAGISDNLDVVQAQENLASAEDFEYAGLYGYHFARAKLARAMGEISEW